MVAIQNPFEDSVLQQSFYGQGEAAATEHSMDSLSQELLQ